MVLLRVKTKDGILHVPVNDVKSVLEHPDGSGVLTLKDREPLEIRQVGLLIQAINAATDHVVTPMAPTSIFEAIFGK